MDRSDRRWLKARVSVSHGTTSPVTSLDIVDLTEPAARDDGAAKALADLVRIMDVSASKRPADCDYRQRHHALVAALSDAVDAGDAAAAALAAFALGRHTQDWIVKDVAQTFIESALKAKEDRDQASERAAEILREDWTEVAAWVLEAREAERSEGVSFAEACRRIGRRERTAGPTIEKRIRNFEKRPARLTEPYLKRAKLRPRRYRSDVPADDL